MANLERLKARQRALEEQARDIHNKRKALAAAERLQRKNQHTALKWRIADAWEEAGLFETGVHTDPEALANALQVLKDLLTPIEHAAPYGTPVEYQEARNGQESHE